MKKADDLFNRYGIRSVSMDDIAQQLGMSKKTLYQYYTDKEELVAAVFTGTMEENRQGCLQDQVSAENALHEVFLAFDRVQDMMAQMNPVVLFDLEKYHPAVFRKFIEYKNGFLYGMIRSNIERGIREEVYRSDFDVDIITRFRISSIMLSFNSDVFPSNRNNGVLHIEQEILHFFLHGLSTSKGEKLIQKYINQRNKIQVR
ncbi:MAG TPA: TetR/AcrR family transcriptional regulator [Chitinophagaceae bacterium]|nr:TetR/AcrR family transcriptional regulator [Chitinophagaceae bacterium]